MSISNLTSREYEPLFRPYSIEPMRERDLIGVVDIEESSGLNRWGYDAYRRELFTNPNSIMIVARSQVMGPAVIGFFAGWIIEDELHVNNVASHQDYRRIGVGRSLMEAAIDEARRRGVVQVILEVRASNEAAQLLYRSLGFGFVGRRRDYYRLPTEDALVMKLKLQ
ncbi:MAG TPA: ribosomal protein S18-alanine N-acetyltransferase [Blastocatellia bacterium]|nr:ribosomal protein S18-alanine N-acetyltransferase [Blastocatellia bacterium]